MADFLEPDAAQASIEEYYGWDTDAQRADAIIQTSIAISLKRIADALCTPVISADPDVLAAMTDALPGRIFVRPPSYVPPVSPSLYEGSVSEEPDPKCSEAGPNHPAIACPACWIPF